LKDHNLSFSIHNLYDEQLIDIRPGTLRKRQLLGVWIKHLCLNANEHHYQTLTLSKGKHRAETSVINPLAATDAKQILQRLLENHDAGILAPLHFLPECSFTFASEVASGKSRQEALQQVYNIWNQDRTGTEGQDPYWRRLINSNTLFDEAFEHLAIETYTPLLASWSDA
jgi:exodeoxyribonuclease V gamma subunit